MNEKIEPKHDATVEEHPASREAESADVYRVTDGGRQYIVIGTAHISQESADLVKTVIDQEHPDVVCVELDERRYKSLSDPKLWENLDLREILRRKQMSALIVQLMLGSYQRRLGSKLGVLPGMELLKATQVAKEAGIPVELSDRDVSITLRRAWRMTPFTKKLLLLSSLLASLFESPDIDEKQLKELRQQDVLSELLKELGEQMPSLKKVLIDERDEYLAEKIKSAEGCKVVAVVGAGHVNGILNLLRQPARTDLKPLEHVPPVSSIWKAAGYGIPIVIVGSILYIGGTKGAGAAGYNAVYWILANGIPSALGALLAWAHPLTIVSAFVAAPITSLTPVIGAGYVTAFIQAWLRPPRVHELKSVADDMGHFKQWWNNRLLKVFLAFLLPGLGSLVGTYVGGYEIIKNLF